jgi:hypothetical protein
MIQSKKPRQPSWKTLTNQLVTHIQTLKTRDHITELVRDDLLGFVEDIQKAIYDKYESRPEEIEDVTKEFELEKELNELRATYEMSIRDYEQHIEELKNDHKYELEDLQKEHEELKEKSIELFKLKNDQNNLILQQAKFMLQLKKDYDDYF